MRVDKELMGVPPLGKTLYIYHMSSCQKFQKDNQCLEVNVRVF